MNKKNLIAVSLVIVGIVMLGYSCIRFTTSGKAIDFQGSHILQTIRHHFVPQTLGCLALIGGIVLFVVWVYVQPPWAKSG
jgi:uncharacterized membrane protein YidH (DUF202 family)